MFFYDLLKYVKVTLCVIYRKDFLKIRTETQIRALD